MKNLKAKMKKKAGFTLIEMLIVVAIVAILVAISIPLVGTALESARDATDQANERAAKMAAVAYYLSGDSSGIITVDPNVDVSDGAYYDAEKGVLTETKPTVPYGKCKGGHGTSTYPNADDHTKSVIKVTVGTTGEVTIAWEALS